MRIIVAGGTGFLGHALVERLRQEHDVIVLTRRPRGDRQLAWSPDDAAGAWVATVQGADVIINLAGAPIAAGRWTAARKAAIRDSRVAATRALTAVIRRSPSPPLLINASAIGIYGDRGDDLVTESSPPGTGFLASVCIDWEAEAQRAADVTRVVLLRTGLVLAADDGALAQLALPFKLFAGGPVGSGRQYWSWIHRDDWVDMVRWAVATSGLAGPLNATAPEPVTSARFARELGHALHRPALFPTPGFALRLALGEMADEMILNGQRVVPARALGGGFRFRYPTIDVALNAIYQPVLA